MGQYDITTNMLLLSKIFKHGKYNTLSCFFSSESLLDNLVLSFTEPSLKIFPNPTPRIFFGCAICAAPDSLPFPGEATGDTGPVKTDSEKWKESGF